MEMHMNNKMRNEFCLRMTTRIWKFLPGKSQDKENLLGILRHASSFRFDIWGLHLILMCVLKFASERYLISQVCGASTLPSRKF